MALRGTNQEWARPHSRRIVPECSRSEGARTRSEIAERVGLTVQTASAIVRELAGKSDLLSVRGAAKGRGQPAAMSYLNPDRLATSVSSRHDRTTAHVIASPGHQPVLRGAVAVAVPGFRSPRQDGSSSPCRADIRDPVSNGMAA